MPEGIKRFYTALALAPLVLAWLLYAPSPWFDWVLAALAVAALFELVHMLALPARFGFALAATAAVAMMLAGEHAAVAGLALGLVWALLLALLSRGHDAETLAAMVGKVAMAYWLAVWVLLFVWSLLLIHKLPFGSRFLAGAFVGVWVSDIAAYFAGRRFGRHRLCPALSPGKTVEGAVAGMAAGVAVAASVWFFFASSSAMEALSLGVVLVLAGILGDLLESAIKRTAGAKDSGRLLPGHGGLLDRVDALIPAVAISGLLWIGL